eukprot:21848_1
MHRFHCFKWSQSHSITDPQWNTQEHSGIRLLSFLPMDYHHIQDIIVINIIKTDEQQHCDGFIHFKDKCDGKTHHRRDIHATDDDCKTHVPYIGWFIIPCPIHSDCACKVYRACIGFIVHAACTFRMET